MLTLPQQHNERPEDDANSLGDRLAIWSLMYYGIMGIVALLLDLRCWMDSGQFEIASPCSVPTVSLMSVAGVALSVAALACRPRKPIRLLIAGVMLVVFVWASFFTRHLQTMA